MGELGPEPPPIGEISIYSHATRSFHQQNRPRAATCLLADRAAPRPAGSSSHGRTLITEHEQKTVSLAGRPSIPAARPDSGSPSARIRLSIVGSHTKPPSLQPDSYSTHSHISSLAISEPAAGLGRFARLSSDIDISTPSMSGAGAGKKRYNARWWPPGLLFCHLFALSLGGGGGAAAAAVTEASHDPMKVAVRLPSSRSAPARKPRNQCSARAGVGTTLHRVIGH
jgi:hypothetical protein